MFILLLWRIVGKVLRRVGWGGLLVPVAAMGIALAGVHFWTVALVLIALAVVLRKPLLAAALLPLSMVAAGLSGLVVAATTPGGSMNYFVRAVMDKPRVAWEALPQVVAGYIPATGGPVTYVVPKGTVVWTNRATVHQQVLAQLPWVRYWTVHPGGAGKPLAFRYLAHKPPPAPVQAWSVAGVSHSLGWWQGHLLVPVALLLLTIGLWLAPRMLRGLRPMASARMPELRRWLAANRWALLLPPAVGVGMVALGANPWTIAAVVAALLVIVIRWPVITADLVPFALAALAAIGYLIAARWQSASPGFYQHPMFYGPVWVDGPKSAIAAGAEASAFLALGAWLVPRTIGARLRTAPDADLAGRVARLTESRGHAVDAAAAELRRIERDLHDGAQARLVALGMNLRAVERVLPDSPQAALALVAEARDSSVRALNELRDLIRGICPPVLADRGLGHAVQALVLDTPLPTALEVDLPGRLPAPVESACYFAVAEALANAVKHSGARHAGIRIRHASGLLRLEVADDGVGGADPERGTGLQGVERRLGTFDGIMAVSSPPGGPTMIVMEVPCALLSPKTCSC
ncbi:MAG TPA: histidine kinase [Streptosporangiaceae bacterium]|nr:histidine kinase [Streptosporangiaceae bacterium]